MRTRRDVHTISLGDAAAAETEPWDPVLDTYARGVALMQERDAQGSADSWRWAANTHGIPNGTAPDPMWDQCAHASRFFLPWHRAYVAWFERTIRTLTGEDDWALPYWDYDPQRPDTLHLPVEVTVEMRTVEGESVPNALFVPGRFGDPLPEADVDLVGPMSEPRFLGVLPDPGFGGADREGFFGDVESRPHNDIHMDIGGLMQSPATAAQDPVFWLHHCNIDRLWEVWRRLEGSVEITAPGAAPPLVVRQWRSAMFWFGDQRTPATYTTADVEDLTSAAMGYDYETITLPEAVATAVARARADRVPSQGGGLSLDGTEPSWAPVGATFDLVSGEEREVAFTTPLGLDDTPPTRLVLELAGARATAPHAAYVLEVRATPDAAPHDAGRFSTFGLAGTPDDEERGYLVDATAVLPALLDEGWSGGALTVRLVPEPGRRDPGGDGVDGGGVSGGGNGAERGIRVRQVTVYTA